MSQVLHSKLAHAHTLQTVHCCGMTLQAAVHIKGTNNFIVVIVDAKRVLGACQRVVSRPQSASSLKDRMPTMWLTGPLKPSSVVSLSGWDDKSLDR